MNALEYLKKVGILYEDEGIVCIGKHGDSKVDDDIVYNLEKWFELENSKLSSDHTNDEEELCPKCQMPVEETNRGKCCTGCNNLIQNCVCFPGNFKISMCAHCHSMTHTIRGLCGKCKGMKQE